MIDAELVDDEARAVTDWLRGAVAPAARLTADSRQVAPGDVFVAWPGERHDGRRHIAGALVRGAAAVLYEAEDAQTFAAQLRALSVPARAVPGLRRAAGAIASSWLDEPSERLTVIAVTGTNGKTSCTHWIAEGCNAQAAAPVAAVVGTLGAGLPGRLADAGLTTPDALALQQHFARFVADGLEVAAIEASSIGLVQHRLDGTHIAIAVLTNLTRDHLDYHGSMDAYADAKAGLFAWPGLEAAVVNLEDPLSARLLERLPETLPAIGYLIDDAGDDAVAAARVEVALAHADRCAELLIAAPGDRLGQFVLTLLRRPDEDDEEPTSISVDVTLAPLGRFNMSNALAVAGAWRALDWPMARIAAGLAALRPVPGRLEIVGDVDDHGVPLAVVDYAHTPDALTHALGALRPIARARGGRLWCVFGAGGDRDPGKRPLMAAAAEGLADRLVLTSDNPRGESPDAIIAGLLAGLRTSPAEAGGPRVEIDRGRAIALAIAEAASADVLLIAGKGHEDYQEVAGVRQPFSDVAVARQALAARAMDSRSAVADV